VNLVPLEETTELITDGTHGSPKRTEDSNGIPLLSAKNVFDGEVRWDDFDLVPPSELQEFQKRVRLKKGDVLMTCVGTIGRAAVWQNERPVVFFRSVAIIRPKSNLRPEYLEYVIRSADFQYELRRRTKRSSQGGVYLTDIKSMLIIVPSLTKQDRIVDLLDEADELRKLRTRADHRTAALIPAQFHEMFGDPTRLEKMHWSSTPLGEFADVSYGLADKLDASTKPENGTRILTISNVLLNGSIDTGVEKYSVAEPDKRSKARLQGLDLLFNWRNGSEAHIGKTAIWEEQVEGEILHVSFLLKIRVDRNKASPYFLWVLLNRLRETGYFTRNARMQINRKFNASELSALRLPLPPMPLQEEFAKRVKEIRDLEAKQAASRHRLDALFESMLHRAFRGEL
jgi:type I restriction enzyme S subunit